MLQACGDTARYRSISAFSDTTRNRSISAFGDTAHSRSISAFGDTACLNRRTWMVDAKKNRFAICFWQFLILDDTITLYGQKTLTAVRRPLDDRPTSVRRPSDDCPTRT